jgi:(E)-4-hydroxy-3-methylbut-2-enyl-diphosphate synthase
MTMTDTADAKATARQCIELAEAGSRWCASPSIFPKRRPPCPRIKQRMLDAGCTAPLIGDFHYNGHLLLTRYPDCAARSTSTASTRERRHGQRRGRAVRDHLQGRHRSRQAGAHRRQRRLAEPGARRRQDAGEHHAGLGKTSEEILNECMVISAVDSTELALETGLRKDQIIISCKVSRPRDLLAIYRDLAARPTSRCTSA